MSCRNSYPGRCSGAGAATSCSRGYSTSPALSGSASAERLYIRRSAGADRVDAELEAHGGLGGDAELELAQEGLSLIAADLAVRLAVVEEPWGSLVSSEEALVSALSSRVLRCWRGDELLERQLYIALSGSASAERLSAEDAEALWSIAVRLVIDRSAEKQAAVI